MLFGFITTMPGDIGANPLIRLPGNLRWGNAHQFNRQVPHHSGYMNEPLLWVAEARSIVVPKLEYHVRATEGALGTGIEHLFIHSGLVYGVQRLPVFNPRDRRFVTLVQII